MADAEPAAPVANRIPVFLAKRYAAQVGAHADHHQPFGALGAFGIGGGVDQVGVVVVGAGAVVAFLGAVVDEDRPAVPFQGQSGADRKPGNVHIDIRQRRDIRRRVHAVDQWPDGGAHGDGAGPGGGIFKEIARLPDGPVSGSAGFAWVLVMVSAPNVFSWTAMPCPSVRLFA